jgi:uncharacterized oxidoreductase
MKLSNNKILITGGATGIGYAMAERFIKENNSVIICGRRLSALTEAQEKLPSLIIRQCDLSVSSDRESLYKWIQDEHPDLNVLVNNAGIQHWMDISETDFYNRAQEEITINLEAPLHLTSLFINLKSVNTIVNVTSALAYVPRIKAPVYSATKAFFHSLTISLQALLKEKNIEVIEVIPPALNTDLGGKGIHDFAPPVCGFIEAVFDQLQKGRTTITFGFSELLSEAGKDVFQRAYKQMNELES